MTTRPAFAAAAAAIVSLQLAAPVHASEQTPPERAQPAANALARMALGIPSDARYRAIFCGQEGTEIGRGYSRALAGDLNKLEAAGLKTAQAIAYLDARACRGK